MLLVGVRHVCQSANERVRIQSAVRVDVEIEFKTAHLLVFELVVHGGVGVEVVFYVAVDIGHKMREDDSLGQRDFAVVAVVGSNDLEVVEAQLSVLFMLFLLFVKLRDGGRLFAAENARYGGY